MSKEQDKSDDSEQSIEQILNIECDLLEKIVFKVNQSTLNAKCSFEIPEYVQIKVKEYYSLGKKMKMLQITNVTNHILYNEFKAKH